LTKGLRALAANDELRQAPVGVEANLLARFREQHRAAENAPPVSAPVLVEMPPRRVSRLREWRTQAVAAAVLLMFAIGGAVMLRTPKVDAPHTSGAVASKEKTNPTRLVTSGPANEVAAVDEAANPTATIEPEKGESGGGQKLTKNEADILLGRPTARKGGVTSVPRSRVNQSQLNPTSSEIMTDFMPVTYGDNLNSIESGRIVRVEMPRSALAQFGLPVNMERANERVKADVIIGDDGMARAIRFVR